jgi:hypothetical protein
MKGASRWNLLVGAWLLFSPTVFVLGVGAVEVDAVLFGMAVIALALSSLSVSPENHLPARLNLVVGLWMFISTWVIGYGTTAGLWNGMIVGGLLVGFSVIRMSRYPMTVLRACPILIEWEGSRMMTRAALAVLAAIAIGSVQGRAVTQANAVQIVMSQPGGGQPVVRGTADASLNRGGRLRNVTLSVPGTPLQITADEVELEGPYLVLFGDVRLRVTPALGLIRSRGQVSYVGPWSFRDRS